VEPLLGVANGFQCPIAGLGKVRPLQKLSQKRITMAVREALREESGKSAVNVTCGAECVEGTWKGKCSINGEEFIFHIVTGTYGHG
jgi:hypothetical protein